MRQHEPTCRSVQHNPQHAQIASMHDLQRAQRTALPTHTSLPLQIVFTVDRSCQLLGVGLCGTEGAYTVDLDVFEVGPAVQACLKCCCLSLNLFQGSRAVWRGGVGPHALACVLLRVITRCTQCAPGGCSKLCRAPTHAQGMLTHKLPPQHCCRWMRWTSAKWSPAPRLCPRASPRQTVGWG